MPSEKLSEKPEETRSKRSTATKSTSLSQFLARENPWSLIQKHNFMHFTLNKNKQKSAIKIERKRYREALQEQQRLRKSC